MKFPGGMDRPEVSSQAAGCCVTSVEQNWLIAGGSRQKVLNVTGGRTLTKRLSGDVRGKCSNDKQQCAGSGKSLYIMWNVYKT